MRAVTPTRLSISIAPYPIGRTYDSFVIIFGVVPLDTRAWKPDTAPHMTQMNTNGKMLPSNVGPPLTKVSFSMGAWRDGLATQTLSTKRATVPILRKLER